MHDLPEGRLFTDLFDGDDDRPELIERPRKYAVAGPLVDRQAFARQCALVDRRRAGDHEPIDGNPLPRPDYDLLLARELVDRHVALFSVANDVRLPRTEIENPLDRAGSPVDRVTLDAFAAQGNEHDERGNRMLSEQDRRQAGDREGQVGPDSTREQAVERVVQNSRTAQHGCQKCQTEPECHAIGRPGRIAAGANQHVGQQKQPHAGRQQVQRSRCDMKAGFFRVRRIGGNRVALQQGTG